ncbi:MAG: bifunctional riboflavin kinase/FAD synthetase [Candidatus Margulisiibacteriota bacterium]
MKIIRHPSKGKLQRPVVALGTFDGVHLGHRRVIEAAVSYAKKIGAHSAAITFDPHPQEVIAPARGLKLLTTLAEREALLADLGIDSVIVSRFTSQLRKLSYRQYVERYLVKKLGVRAVFVGYDYALGKGRSGTAAALKKLGEEFGFEVKVIPPVKVRGQIVKSGLIRELLLKGDFKLAYTLLGHPYRLTGKVVKGKGIGAKILATPTANLKPDPRKLIPAAGVYGGFTGGRKCAVNIGLQPTFGHNSQLVEAHLLNFNGRLLGRTLALDLFSRLRPERRFASVAQLKVQIKKDIARLRGM